MKIQFFANLHYQDETIPVEITDAWTDADGRPFARVEASRGKPFTQYTMGGPVAVAVATVRREALTTIRPSAQPDQPFIVCPVCGEEVYPTTIPADGIDPEEEIFECSCGWNPMRDPLHAAQPAVLEPEFVDFF